MSHVFSAVDAQEIHSSGPKFRSRTKTLIDTEDFLFTRTSVTTAARPQCLKRTHINIQENTFSGSFGTEAPERTIKY